MVAPHMGIFADILNVHTSFISLLHSRKTERLQQRNTDYGTSARLPFRQRTKQLQNHPNNRLTNE